MVGPMGRPERVLTLRWRPLPGTAPGILCPTSSLLHSHTLIDVYYLSHAFPRQMNHQQRKPTRPPTTTITATDIPAMAPVLRLGPVGTHVSPSSRCPSLHTSHMLSALHVEHSAMLHVTQPYQLPVGFLLPSQAVHFADAMPAGDGAAGASHVLQPSTPT